MRSTFPTPSSTSRSRPAATGRPSSYPTKWIDSSSFPSTSRSSGTPCSSMNTSRRTSSASSRSDAVSARRTSTVMPAGIGRSDLNVWNGATVPAEVRPAVLAVLFGRAVVRRFVGDHHVVGVAFGLARRGDADELAALLEFGDRPRADVAHARLHPADELVELALQTSLVGFGRLDALGDVLLVLVGLVLEVAVAV